MMQQTESVPDHSPVQRALAELEQRIEAVRAGSLEELVEVQFDAEHPIGALALAVNEMIQALRAAHGARQQQEQELESRVATIQQQNAAIRELSSPVIEVWQGVLTLPVVGYIDSERASSMTINLLEQVVKKRASLAIIDLTGMRGVGAEVIDHIVRMARCVKLLGASCSVSGVRPEVARAIIEVGSELGDIRSYPTLRAALTHYVGTLLKSRRQSLAAAAAR